RQFLPDSVRWTQPTHRPNGAALYRLVLRDAGYVLDGKVREFEVAKEDIKVRQKDGSLRVESLTIRRSVHGPVVAERDGSAFSLRVAALARRRWFEPFCTIG